MPETDVSGTGGSAQGGEAGTRTDSPYRAEAVPADGQWHLTVQSLADHPDRGEVDALVVTVTPRTSGHDLPAADLDRTLDQCGFARHGDWTPTGNRWTAPCRHVSTSAAPPAPPPR